MFAHRVKKEKEKKLLDPGHQRLIAALHRAERSNTTDNSSRPPFFWLRRESRFRRVVAEKRTRSIS